MCLVGEKRSRCSNRCAKPLRPGTWLAAPTWYQTSTATCGRRWASLRITVRPLGSLYFSNLISGSPARAAEAASARTTRSLFIARGLSRRPRGGKVRISGLGIARHLAAHPGGNVEGLVLALQLDLGQPQVAVAEMVQLPPAQPAAPLAQAAAAEAQEGLGVLDGDGVVEFG